MNRPPIYIDSIDRERIQRLIDSVEPISATQAEYEAEQWRQMYQRLSADRDAWITRARRWELVAGVAIGLCVVLAGAWWVTR